MRRASARVVSVGEREERPIVCTSSRLGTERIRQSVSNL
jgi:hypothetical protein